MKNHISEVLKQAENGIRAVFDDDNYKEYLKTMSKFHYYSVRNVALIKAEKPDATYVAGFSSWEKNFGRHVKKGEKGIPIIAYSPEIQYVERTIENDEGKKEPVLLRKIIPKFTIKHVFDISQTEGKPLPKLIENLSGKIDNYKILFQSIKDISPYPIGFEKIESGANGYCDVAKKEIKIREGLSERQTIKTAIHEVAHADMHTDKEENFDRKTKEIEAEAVAFVVCDHFGLDTSTYSFPYIAAWSSDKELKELEGSLDRIQHKSSELIKFISDRYLALDPPEAEVNRTVSAKSVENITANQMLEAEHIKAMLDYKIPVGYYTVQEKETGKQVSTVDELMSIPDAEYNSKYETVYKDIKLYSQVKDGMGEDGFCYMQGGMATPTVNPYIMSPNEMAVAKFLITEFMQSDQWDRINESLKYNAPVKYDYLLKTRDKYLGEDYFMQSQSRYPNKTEAEIRNIAGYLTITDDSTGVSLPNTKGIWHTEDSTKINGDEYYLMYNDDGRKNVIVDRTGTVMMSGHCNFEDLRDRLAEESLVIELQKKTKARKRKQERER